jgi:hypothetical protein
MAGNIGCRARQESGKRGEVTGKESGGIGHYTGVPNAVSVHVENLREFNLDEAEA